MYLCSHEDNKDSDNDIDSFLFIIYQFIGSGKADG